jgi:hypothetical protein
LQKFLSEPSNQDNQPPTEKTIPNSWAPIFRSNNWRIYETDFGVEIDIDIGKKVVAGTFQCTYIGTNFLAIQFQDSRNQNARMQNARIVSLENDAAIIWWFTLN